MPRLNTTFSYSPEKNCAEVRTRLCNFFVKLLRDDVVCGYATHRWPNGPHWGNFDGGAQPPSSPLRLRWQRMERQIFFYEVLYFYILIKHAPDGRENHPSPGRDETTGDTSGFRSRALLACPPKIPLNLVGQAVIGEIKGLHWGNLTT